MPIKTVQDGEVLLECDYNPSNPDPAVTWFADGTTMLDESGGRQSLEGGRYLFIQPVTAAVREMRYHCEVNSPRYNNGMAIRAPTTYTLNANINNGEFIEYKELGSRVGVVGQPVQFIYAAAGRSSSGSREPIFVECPPEDNPLVALATVSRPVLEATPLEGARNMTEVTFTCNLFGLNRNISGTITIPGADFVLFSGCCVSPKKCHFGQFRQL